MTAISSNFSTIPGSRRNRSSAVMRSNLAEILKFGLAMVGLLAVVICGSIQRNQAVQAQTEDALQLRNMKREILELQKRYDNGVEELERLKGGNNILLRARRLGLRPTDSTQQITCGIVDGRVIMFQGRNRVAQF